MMGIVLKTYDHMIMPGAQGKKLAVTVLVGSLHQVSPEALNPQP